MRSFYFNLTLGGYDLGGVMALMGHLLDIGVPLKSIEESTFSRVDSPEYIYKITTVTNVTSITLEPLSEAFSSTLNSQPGSGSANSSEASEYTMGSQGGSQSSSNSQTESESSSGSQDESTSTSTNNRDVVDGCDCSCEKYTEYMKIGKMSKKEKKNMDMGKIQQIDMNCIKDCIMAWAKCAKMGN